MKKDKRLFLLTLFMLYCFFMLWMTIFKRDPGMNRKIVFDLFWAFREWIAGSKNGKTESLQYLKNVLFFVPFGVLFPWKEKGWKVLLFSATAFSVLIEVIQYVFLLGWCELDDVISNALGAFIGFGLWILLSRLIGDNHKWKEF